MCESLHCHVVKSDPSSAVGLPDFLEDNWQTNGWLPLWIDCSALFQQYDCDMSSFSEKRGDHLLGSALCASNFSLIWLIMKHPYSRLLFTFGLIRLNPRFITCHDIIDVFRIVFLEHFLRPIDTSLFLAIGKVCGIQREKIFLTVKCSCNIEYMLVPLMPNVVSISRWVTWRSCNISWRTALMVFGKTDFGRPSRNLSWSELRPRLNSPHHR